MFVLKVTRSQLHHLQSFDPVAAEKCVLLECGPMPNVMAALPNIGGTLCSTPQSLADAHYWSAFRNAAKTRNPLKFAGVPQTRQQISAVTGPKFTVLRKQVEEVLLFNTFFRLSICALLAKTQPDKVVRWCRDGDFLAIFSEQRVVHFRPAF